MMYLPLARGNPPPANIMEGVMMLIRLPGGKAVCVSSYWGEKECLREQGVDQRYKEGSTSHIEPPMLISSLTTIN